MRERSIVAPPLEGKLASDEANVLFSVWALARSVEAMLDEALAPSGIGADEFALYSVLRTGGAITPTELARWMVAAPTTVSSYIKRLQARGHLRRTSDPDDGRRSLLELTPSGLAQHQAAARLFAPRLNLIEETLGRQEPTVRRALASLRRAMDVEGARPSEAPRRERR